MATKHITDRAVCFAALGWRDVPESDCVVLLAERTGEPRKVCVRAIERTMSKGLVNCGVSLRTAWITDLGRELLRTQLLVVEGIHGTWHYHLRPANETLAYCQAAAFRTEIPLSSWGVSTHLKERYCKACENAAIIEGYAAQLKK